MDASLPSLLVREPDRGFEELVRTYQHRVFAYALALTGHHDVADDVAQDTFVRAYRALRRYSAEQIERLSLSPWLHRITLNLVRNRARDRQAFLRKHDAERAELASGPGAAPGADHEAEGRERQRALTRLVASLPPHHRDAVVLRWVQGMSYAEAAEVLGRAEGTVKSDVHRGLATLRRLIAEQSEVLET
jgi:RNA polymerase sigma factor (sigma-70 family)